MKRKAGIARNLVNNSLNFPIQSLAASIVSKASIAIARQFKAEKMEAYICLSVHDELCILAPEKEVDKVCQIMQYNMENETKLSIPLQAEPVVGIKYGEVK
jgi:DNA polymerase I-like protein with 3'-5' exonuclease and polymerase domains